MSSWLIRQGRAQSTEVRAPRRVALNCAFLLSKASRGNKNDTGVDPKYEDLRTTWHAVGVHADLGTTWNAVLFLFVVLMRTHLSRSLAGLYTVSLCTCMMCVVARHMVSARQFLIRATSARGNAAQGTSLPTEEKHYLGNCLSGWT